MSQPRQRHPRELLYSIHNRLVQEWCYCKGPMPYRNAIRTASSDVVHLLNNLPLYPNL